MPPNTRRPNQATSGGGTRSTGQRIATQGARDSFEQIRAAIEGGSPIRDLGRIARGAEGKSNKLAVNTGELLAALGPAFESAAAPGIAQAGSAIQQGVEQRLQRSGLIGQSGGARTTTGVGALAGGAAQGATASLQAKVRQAIIDLIFKASQGDVQSQRQLEAAKLQAKAGRFNPLDFLTSLGVPAAAAGAKALLGTASAPAGSTNTAGSRRTV